MQIGLDDSDVAIMETPQWAEWNSGQVANAEQLIAADATDRQISEIKAVIAEMRMCEILETEIMAIMRGE
jgi:hypothetical protein